MKRACIWFWLGTWWLSLGCSTPISSLPQVPDEEEGSEAGTTPDGGSPHDAGLDAGHPDAGRADAGTDSGMSAFGCDVYGAGSSCPAALPTAGASCSTPSDGRCFYAGTPAGRLRVAECQRAGAGASWKLSNARCSYNCDKDLPQGGNFFSIDTSDCLARAAHSCRTAQSATSQEGVDQLLHEIALRCRIPDGTTLGVTFTPHGCADVVFYPMGPRLNPNLQQCLSQELVRLRLDCDAACGISPEVPI